LQFSATHNLDFLNRQGKQQQAMVYFKRALAIPARLTQVFADTQLHEQIKLTMEENIPSLLVKKQAFSVAYKE